MPYPFPRVLRSNPKRRIAAVLLAAILAGGSIAALAQTAPPPTRPPASQPAAGQAKEVIEKHEDGSFKLKYQVDSEGRKQGFFQQFHKGGKIQIRGGYTADAKSGAWLTYDEAGKLLESITYSRTGEPDGPCLWTDAATKAGFKGTNRAGGFAGPVSIYDANGRIIRTAAYPRPLGEIKQTWTTLHPTDLPEPKYLEPTNPAAPYKVGKIAPETLEQALKVTKLYRYLSGVPWQHLALDPTANSKAQHGAVITHKVGSLSHTPSKPDDMDEAFFNAAYAGCKQSNLHMGRTDILSGLTGYMDDSDAKNIAGIGHRRWLLKPGLKKVGFGFSGRFTAMHIMDGTRDVPVFQYVAFPGEGYYPVQLIGAHYAWSLHFHPSKMQVPEAGELKVKLLSLDERFQQTGETKSEVVSVIRDANQGWHVIVFKPAFEKLVTGKYWVDVTGLKAPNGKPVPFGYIVDLIDVTGEKGAGTTIEPTDRRRRS